MLSILLRPDDTRAELYRSDLDGQTLAVSFATVGELYRWTLESHWGEARIREMESRLSRMVFLNYTEGVARHWAQIKALPGVTISDNDAWIAACARVYGCVLVTHDSDFNAIPALTVINYAGEAADP